MAGPPGDYTSLNTVKTLHGIGISETGDDAVLRRFVRDASRLADLWTKRTWLPYLETKRHERNRIINPYNLHVFDDLLELNSLVNGNGGSIPIGDVYLTPRLEYPKHFIRVVDNSGSYFDIAYNQETIDVEGVWGAHFDYNNAWVDVQDNIIGGITSTVNNFTVSANAVAADGFPAYEIGWIIKINSEYMLITNYSATTLTVIRGVRGTTAAAHSDGDDIYVFRPDERVVFGVNEIVKWMYEHRDEVQSGVQLSPNLGVVIVNELPEVHQMLKGLRRKAARIGKI